MYWLGSEAVLYVQEPELIQEISSSGSFNWGRPAFLKNDRFPLFGNGLIMAEDQDWLHQRRIIGQALTAEKVKVRQHMVNGQVNLGFIRFCKLR